MNNEKFVTSCTSFAHSRNIDRDTVIKILDEVLRTLLQKKFGENGNYHIIINPEKGDLQMWQYKQIISDDSEELIDDDKITLSDAKKIESDFEIGEEVAQNINLQIFGRRAIAQALQLLMKKIQEIEREGLYQRYKKKEGELINAVIYLLTSKVTILHDGQDQELILPKENQIPNEKYKKGSRIYAIIQEVILQNNRVNIILTRNTPSFLQKTLETQISEITDGIVKIKQVARRPGQRSKVVVSTEDDRIDPVGACIGLRGQRIRSISQKELWNEQIDIIGYTDHEELFIKRALSPAQIHKIQENDDRIIIHLKPDQVPLAIGIEGQNIDLASQLIGKPIDIYREFSPEQEKPLEELSPDISESLIHTLIAKGFKTVQSVVETPKEKVKIETGFTTDQIDTLYALLNEKYTIKPYSSNTHSS